MPNLGKQPDLCMDLKEDMLSLGTALKEDEKKAYESAYTSCLDLKKQKCLRIGPTEDEIYKRWMENLRVVFKYQT